MRRVEWRGRMELEAPTVLGTKPARASTDIDGLSLEAPIQSTI